MIPKVFTATTIQDLERQVAAFLNDNPGIEVQHMAQSESDASTHGWSITFTILYKKSGS